MNLKNPRKRDKKEKRRTTHQILAAINSQILAAINSQGLDSIIAIIF
jgi:hypothetical protein